MSERMNVEYLGTSIGTASGWDGDPGQYVQFYDFVPNIAQPHLQSCECLAINEAQGTIEEMDRDGLVTNTYMITWEVRPA